MVCLNGRDLRLLSFTKRKTAFRKVVKAGVINFEAVRSPALYETAAGLDLERIIAKRSVDPYMSETRSVNVKDAGYPQKEGRGDLFHPRV